MKKQTKREFGSIRELQSGKFQASYKLEARTIYNPQAFLTRGEAKAWLASEQYKLMNGEKPESLRRPKSITFGECAADYLALKTDRNGYPLRPSYRAKCELHLRGKLAGFVNLEITKITSQLIERWWVDETRLGHRTSTANAYRFLRAVLNKAIRDDQHKGPNPCQVKGAASASTGTKPRAFSTEELRRVVAHASPQLAIYLMLSFIAALRFEEATALRVCDVVRQEKDGQVMYSLRIARAVVRIGGEFLIGPTKTEAGNRITPLPRAIYSRLEDYLAGLSSEAESLLFPSELHGTFIHNSVLNKQLKRACEAAGIDGKRFSLHSLRRGGATSLSENGATPAEVQQLLGDASLDAAMRYIKPTTRLSQLVEKFELESVS